VAKMMRAGVVQAFGKPLSIEEIPIPTPGPGEVLIKVVASGVCHTDLHAAEGDWPLKPSLLMSARLRRAAPRLSMTRERSSCSPVARSRGGVGKGAHRRQVYAVCTSLTALRAVELLSTLCKSSCARLCATLRADLDVEIFVHLGRLAGIKHDR